MKVRLPKFPNQNSKETTLASLNIDLHYQELSIIERWTWERFTRLAAFCEMTHAELASMICLPHSEMRDAQKRDEFPGPACLLLTLLEAKLLKDYTDVIENPFPQNALQRDS